MSSPVRRIAINTGGGDAPGLNAVIRAVTLAGLRRGWQVLGIQRGYEGLLDTSKIITLTPDSVRGITHMGGTILGTTNKGDPFQYPTRDASDATVLVDRSDEVVANLRRLGIDVLIPVGGDGSLRIAHGFAVKGVQVVGVPKTIDNDLSGTVVTFGFDTAVGVATEALGRLHSTAEAHDRVFVVEVMGRYAGWIALNSGVAASTDVILIPEIPFDIDRVCAKIMEREALGRRFSIVVVAEGARPKGGELVTRGPAEPGREVRLGGIGEQVAAAIQERTRKETRTVVLGHLQRGGLPTTFDRLLALRFGAAAVRLAAEGIFDVMVALDPPEVLAVPLSEAIARNRTVPLNSDTMLTARELGISFGDQE